MNHLALYSPLHEWRIGDPPGTPFVHIAVGSNSRENGYSLLSSELANPVEIDEAVTQLKAELDEFAAAAKRELLLLHEKMKGM